VNLFPVDVGTHKWEQGFDEQAFESGALNKLKVKSQPNEIEKCFCY